MYLKYFKAAIITSNNEELCIKLSSFLVSEIFISTFLEKKQNNFQVSNVYK